MGNRYFFDEALKNSKVQMSYGELQQIQMEYESLERIISSLKQDIKDKNLFIEKSGDYYTIHDLIYSIKEGYGGGIIPDLESELEKILLSMTSKEFDKWKKCREDYSFENWIGLRGQIKKVKKNAN